MMPPLSDTAETAAQQTGDDVSRLRVVIRGAVQGVGFRPFVFRIATELQLKGWVSNTSQGVFIEVEGPRTTVEAFLLRLEPEKPPRAFIQSLESSFLDPIGFSGFEIRESRETGPKTALVLPDIATCPDCLREMFDVSNRRYLYPFTNCTNCGPRFTIIEALPYDRNNTSMKSFEMCPACRREYEDPLDRRFHAQPNACPVCGPHVELWNPAGEIVEIHRQAILGAVKAIREGKIVAVKGLGGFHLVADARNDKAVRELRRRKNREEKPFAVMMPSLEAAQKVCRISDLERRMLLSPEAPIVLLERSNPSAIAPAVAPGNPSLGVMLPYTPLHHILLHELKFPVVATSGNVSDEPICTDEQEALRRLNKIADYFLVHDRPIVRHVDDSVTRLVAGRELVLRRARGFAPLPVAVAHDLQPALAVGAHLKNTVAITAGSNIVVSQHIGDLETKQSLDAFHKVIGDFQALYETQPAEVVCDLHPDYLSTSYAKSTGLPTFGIQHHYAHIASCMAENQLEGPVLGVSWDGTGYGSDGTIWGGEFLLAAEGTFQRVAALKSFRLPGGDQAVKEPRRTALGLLHELYGDLEYSDASLLPITSFSKPALGVVRQMLEKDVQSPWTTSAGRLFDAVASIIGLRHIVNFEGQAAMELEYAATGQTTDDSYEFLVSDSDNRLVVDWSPMIMELIEEKRQGVLDRILAAKFHNTLAEMILAVALRIREFRVVLSGGCFQNKILTERTVRLLEASGFRAYWHQRIPPNDGGIAAGQIFARSRQRTSPTMNEPLTEEMTP